jgi:hypothetical protein
MANVRVWSKSMALVDGADFAAAHQALIDVQHQGKSTIYYQVSPRLLLLPLLSAHCALHYVLCPGWSVDLLLFFC